ncbi:MAG: aromatic amino acid lyase, partial [Firmicutes bacterium]|nr:aromatic amino acid lyase [Bacillota bacterium]
MSIIFVNGETLTHEEVVGVARYHKHVEIATEVRDKVDRSRQAVESILTQDRVIYGVNTGFGHLACVRISRD